MSFAAPWWFAGFIPLTAFAIWLLKRRTNSVAVPFLPFWPQSSIAVDRRHRVRRPPLFVILLITALVLALLGATGPRWRSTQQPNSPQVPSAFVTSLSAIDQPHAQVLVRIKTIRWPQPTITVTVESAAERYQRELPVRTDDEVTSFFDFHSLGPTVTATASGQPATIRRAGRRLMVSANSSVPMPLRRLFEIRSQQRVGLTDPVTIEIGPALPTAMPGIVLAEADRPNSSDWTVVDDPLTRGIDWSRLAGGCDAQADWQPLVYHDRSVLIARRAGTAQILAAVQTVDWPAMHSFVVFWTAALDELAGGDGQFDRWTAQPESRVKPQRDIADRDLSSIGYLSAIACMIAASAVVRGRPNPYTALHDEQAANPDR